MSGTTGDDPARQSLPAGFRPLLVSGFTSMAGDGIRLVAIPLLAAALSRRPEVVALVAAFSAAPWLLIAVPAGALVDRWPTVRTACWAHFARAGGAALVVVLVTTGWVSVPALCAVAFLFTSAETFADGASQTLLVSLIPDAQLERANGRFYVVESIALDLVGPLLATATTGLGRAVPFAIATVCYLASALLLGRLPEPSAATAADRSTSAVAGTGIEGPSGPNGLPTPADCGCPTAADFGTVVAFDQGGLRQVWRDSVLRTLGLTVAVLALANAAQDGVVVLYITNVLGLAEQAFPLLMVALSAGILLAGTLVHRLPAKYLAGPAMPITLFGFGASLILVGLVPVVAVAYFGYALLGFSSAAWNVLSTSRRQRRIPRSMVGRVSSAFRVLAWGMTPIGALLGGVLGSSAGVRAVFVVAGAVALLLVVTVGRGLSRPVDTMTTRSATAFPT